MEGVAMSGGTYDYIQFRLNEVADNIKEKIKKNEEMRRNPSGCDEDERYDEATVEKFKEAVAVIKMASIYIHRIDWLLSGDDGEEDFRKRLTEEIARFLDAEE